MVRHADHPLGFFHQHLFGMAVLHIHHFIQCFQIDTLFLSLEGIDLNDGISVVDVQDGHTKKVLVEKAKRVICMADHTKFNKR
jgi:DeoR/GlpR family transcriptional regulator of sugar metabolism